MEVDRNLNRNLVKVRPALACSAMGVATRKGNTPTGQLCAASSFERTNISRDVGVACQRGLPGNSMDNEQWSDDLSTPSAR